MNLGILRALCAGLALLVLAGAARADADPAGRRAIQRGRRGLHQRGPGFSGAAAALGLA